MRVMTDQHTVRDRPPEGAEAPSWVQVSYGAPPRDQRPERTGKVLGWVSLAAIVALVAVAIGGTFAARDLAERQAVNDAIATSQLLAEAVITPALRTTCSRGTRAPSRLWTSVVDDYIHATEATAIVRVKIWTADGRIVYSDEPRLIGQTFALGEEEREVLTRSEDPGRHLRPERGREPVREATTATAARGLRAGLDAERHSAAVRDLCALRGRRRAVQ